MKKRIAGILIIALAVMLLSPAGQMDRVYATEQDQTKKVKKEPKNDQQESHQKEVTGNLKPSGKVNVKNVGISRYAQSVTAYKESFGNQLEGESKALYDRMVQQYVTGQSTEECNYTFQKIFQLDSNSAWENLEEDEDFIHLEEEISEIAQNAVDAFSYDHPEVFWIYNVKYSYRISGQSTETGCLVKIAGITLKPQEVYAGAAAQMAAYGRAVDQAVSQIRSACGETTDRYEILKQVHAYVCEKSSYYQGAEKDEIYTTAPIFLGNGQVVCEGYAKVMKVLCDRLQIPCVCVGGTVYSETSQAEGHMWNEAQMEDGKWYLIDATWNDQSSGIRDTYFLAGSASKGFDGYSIEKERLSSGDFSGAGFKEFVYPTLNVQAYKKQSSETEPVNPPTEDHDKVLPPQSLDGGNTEEGISVSWSMVEGVDGYYIYRKDADGWKVLARQKGEKSCSYEDKDVLSGTSYYYRIVAYKNITDENTGEKEICSEKSEYKKVRRLLCTSVVADVSSGGTVLSWKRITGASGYSISRRVQGSSKWTVVSEIVSGKLCSFTDTTAKNGLTYEYAVQGYFEDSVSVYGETALYCRMNAPKITVYKRKTKTSYQLEWKEHEKASGYQIQYSKSSLFEGRKTKNIAAGKTEYVLSGLAKNRIYYVRIRIYRKADGRTYYSPWSVSSNVKSTRVLGASGIYKKSGKKKILFEIRTQAKQAMYQYDTVQGSCGDGKYSYYILYNRKAEKCKIIKVRQSDWKVIKVSGSLDLDHGNDMTYNTDRKRLVVLHSTGKGKRLSVIRTDTLKVESVKDVKISSVLEGATTDEAKAITGFSAIAYNQTRKQYAIHLGKSREVLLLDAEMEPVRYVHFTKKNNYINQGMEATTDYLLIGQSPKYSSHKYNILSVYDWEGNYISMLQVKKGQELESVYKSGISYYATFYTSYYKIYYKKMKITVKEKGKKKIKTVKLRQKKYIRANYVYKIGKI